MQDWVVSIFRDGTSYTPQIDVQNLTSFRLFWERFEQAIPSLLVPSTPLSTPKCLKRWLLGMSHFLVTSVFAA